VTQVVTVERAPPMICISQHSLTTLLTVKDDRILTVWLTKRSQEVTMICITAALIKMITLKFF